jgi:hypothetical protein
VHAFCRARAATSGCHADRARDRARDRGRACVAIAVPNTIRWQRDQRVKGAAHDVADLLAARALGSDAHGQSRSGDLRAVRHAGSRRQRRSRARTARCRSSCSNDGAAATSNCKDRRGRGEARRRAVRDVRWGVALATTAAPNDPARARSRAPQTRGGTTLSPAGRGRAVVHVPARRRARALPGRVRALRDGRPTALGGAALLPDQRHARLRGRAVADGRRAHPRLESEGGGWTS